MTASNHLSGTDRIAQAATDRHWADADIVVNVQADEPLIPPALIGQVARLLAAHPQSQLATLCTPIVLHDQYLDPNVVKVVTDVHGRALYFSRAPVPWQRDAAAASAAECAAVTGAMRHIGIYAYRVAALKRLTALPPSSLELCEKLEQLRALENGLEIRVARACEAPGPDVNSPEDFARVVKLLSG